MRVNRNGRQVSWRCGRQHSKTMALRRRARKASGFTFVEAMMATILVATAVTSVLLGIGAVSKAQAKSQMADMLQNLAAEKLNELTLNQDPSQLGSAGDFSDRGHPDVSWNIDLTTPAVTDVEEATITVTRGKDSQSLTTQVYVPPTTTTTSGSGTTTP